MEKNLSEFSTVYHQESSIYDRFSQAEDAPGRILQNLLPLLPRDSLLDLGCGTGKYMALLAPSISSLIGVDASAEQLQIAQQKTPGLRYIQADAAHIPLLNQSMSAILACWVLGTVLDESHREAILKESERILRPGGQMFLVENDIGGAFEQVRGRDPDPFERTRRYNSWLLAHGFVMEKRFETFFKFINKKEAKMIFQTIWGEEAAQRINSKKINHRIIIFSRVFDQHEQLS
ncbi:MAG TPA: class I SAM-dependent methyltransferase [Patescibacteria group bacterium]|nr:class I SAM-dependent methyltransferase [Patescibacteria group bacterium]